MSNNDSKLNDNDQKKQDSDTLVENANLLPGFFTALHNAEKFFNTSKKLYESKDYQSSIPISTISMEESFKGLELLTKFRRDQVLTIDDWKDLKNHKHKLTHVMEDALEQLKTASKEDIEKAKEVVAKTGREARNVSVNDVIKNLQQRSGIHSHFQELREGCFYTDWDELKGKWFAFDELSQEMQDALTFFVMGDARINLNLLKMGIERYVNRLRETGQLLEKLPYPSYTELRTPDKWESNNLPFPIQSKIDQVKYEKGLKVMKQFIEEKSFQFLSFAMFRKTMLEYLKVIGKQKDEKWFPHPMIKAMMMAMSLVKEKGKEGENVAALSGDADQTYSGKPMISFNVIAKMNSGVCEFVKITDLSNPDVEFTEDMIEKIIRTEIIIERQQGKDISHNIGIEALNAIGLKTKVIKMDEIPDAIKMVQDMVKNGQYEGVPKDIQDQVLAIKGVEEWDDLDSTARTMIATAYGARKYPEYNIHSTPVDSFRKFKCRITVLQVLEQPYLDTA
ncbi:MAG: hypothetical protein YK1309IOTA_520001 [Marine Group I thaumarchaeote]|nr:MAG: hypothetical protein YK1309IOTA_520001 [Marine Group I thaumarchaeote]